MIKLIQNRICCFIALFLLLASCSPSDSIHSRRQTIVLLDTTSTQKSQIEISELLKSSLAPSGWTELSDGLVSSEGIKIDVVDTGKSVAIMMSVPLVNGYPTEESYKSCRAVIDLLNHIEPFSSAWKKLGKPDRWLDRIDNHKNKR
jgi:hypothetical protein